MNAQLGKKVDIKPTSMTSNETFSLSDYADKKIVLYFYPKDSTPGCTTESIDFSLNYKIFKENNCEIFGISKDSLVSHEKFKKKYQMPFELIADVSTEICQYFSVFKEKSMFGKKYMGIERSTFIIDEQGVLIKEWRKVKVKGHVNEVLEAIKS